MNQDFITILQTLITEQGRKALLDPVKYKAFLADYTHGEYNKESQLLLQALEAGVQKAIDAAEDINVCKQQQVRVLQEKYSLPEKIAEDVVDTMALVLMGDEARTPTETPQSAVTSSPQNKKRKMRNVLIAAAGVVLLVLLIVFIISNARTNTNSSANALDKDTSYAFGMLMAFQMSGSMGLDRLNYDYDAFRDGFRDVNEARETRLSQEKAIEKISEFFARMDEQAYIEGEKNREEGEDYMAVNRQRNDVNTTASGLQYEVLVQGSGARPGPEDTVQVHYEGTLINGTVFDSSYSRGVPAEFPLYAVIQGWTEGLQLMSEGSTYRFVIPSDLAYGPNGAGSIPPNSTLIFKVELLSIIR